MAKKKTEEELIDFTNKAINELVFPKYTLKKAYNYYNGVRDPEQFRYLESNFGIGNPTSLEFIPLIRKHVDAIVGEFLETPIIPKITCKDSKTISNIERDKHLKIVKDVYTYLKNHLNNSILTFLNGRNITDKAIEGQINQIIEDIDQNFISEYEVAAQNVIQYILNSRDTDLIEKLRILLLDLLITGYAFYKVVPSKSGNNIEIKILDPLNTFIDKNFSSNYVKLSYRAVVREWLTKTQILNTYGKHLSEEDIEDLENMYETVTDSSSIYVRSYNNQCTGFPASDGLEAGRELTPGLPNEQYGVLTNRLIPVYTVEWVETDSDFKMQRYEQVKIGNTLYITQNEPVEVVRSQDNPTFCTLSTSGIYFSTRSSEPYSLVLACANLQDKYDVLHFYRDSLLASSGTVGDWLDVSMLPQFLGTKLPERVQKWLEYKKKAGVALIDTSQDGIAFNNNTAFTGFDDTVKAQTIEAIEMAIDRIENTCSSITGVFRERLNGIQQKDAVTNVKVGIQNSFTITKQFTHQMDLLTTELLVDCLNVAKKVWKKGLKGTLILGDKGVKVFTALPEYFTVTDYDINIEASSNIVRDMETIKQIVPELIKAQALDPEDLIEALTVKSMTELRNNVGNSLKKKRQEANQVGQIQQQLEQSQQQLQQLMSENKSLNGRLEALNEAKIKLEQDRLKSETEINWYKARTDKAYKDSVAETNKQKVEVEEAQMYDGNPHNNKVKY